MLNQLFQPIFHRSLVYGLMDYQITINYLKKHNSQLCLFQIRLCSNWSQLGIMIHRIEFPNQKLVLTFVYFFYRDMIIYVVFTCIDIRETEIYPICLLFCYRILILMSIFKALGTQISAICVQYKITVRESMSRR